MNKTLFTLIFVATALYGALLLNVQPREANRQLTVLKQSQDLEKSLEELGVTIEDLKELGDMMDFDAEDEEDEEETDYLDDDGDEEEDDDDDDDESLLNSLTLFKKVQKKTLKFRSFSVLFSLVNIGQAPVLQFGDFTCQSECKSRPWEINKVKEKSFRLTKVQYKGPFNGCKRTCSFNNGKQAGYFAQKINAVYQIADFNLPQFPWLRGKVEIPCNPTIGIGWKGFVVGQKVSLVEKSYEEGQQEPRKQCSLCDLTVTAGGIQVDLTNLPIRFWFCKHKSNGFKLKFELR